MHPHLVQHGVLAGVELLARKALIGGAEEGEPALVIEPAVNLGRAQLLHARCQVQRRGQLQQVGRRCVLGEETKR